MSDTPQGSEPSEETTASSPADEKEQGGRGRFGDGRAAPLYEFQASRFKGGRLFTPKVIRVWPDRIEEYKRRAIRKKGTQAISFQQVAQASQSAAWIGLTSR